MVEEPVVRMHELRAAGLDQAAWRQSSNSCCCTSPNNASKGDAIASAPGRELENAGCVRGRQARTWETNSLRSDERHRWYNAQRESVAFHGCSGRETLAKTLMRKERMDYELEFKKQTTSKWRDVRHAFVLRDSRAV